jgi:hypothetical protein
LVLSSFLSLLIAGTCSAQVEVTFDPASGLYQVFEKRTQFRLTGSIAQVATTSVIVDGKERGRTFHELRLRWNPGTPVEGSIKWFDQGTDVWFKLRYLQGVSGHGYTFPDFTVLPSAVNSFSFRDSVFAPATFGLNETSTPWLFFDDTAHSYILSPASEFLVAKMRGDGKTLVGVGLNDRLVKVPRGLVQESLLTFGDGIQKTWDTWGTALRSRYGRKLPTDSSDVVLQKFGYWTDNGADYYYNYDLKRGYANTLLDLSHRYAQEGIPLGYLQLDSWWYQKTVDNADGSPGGKFKNSQLPEGSWNRYGGLYRYEAHPDLFPTGLASFQKTLGLPLVVHNRWIDRKSPYHQAYKISGVGAVDPRWWAHIVKYLKSSGVTCYEQDWLDHIYDFSPEMASQVGPADAFADGMANAARDDGLTVQYCMPTPRFFLQGVKYPNLTTIRTSGDEFEPGKWAEFLFGSQLAREVGIRPWCDVFKSSETGNLILSVLSDGPVGTGDRMGSEDKANIWRTMRSDGVLIKPDDSIFLSDQSYLDQAAHRDSPYVATTYTDRGGLRTQYVFAFPRTKGADTLNIQMKDVGMADQGYLYDFGSSKGRFVDANTYLHQSLVPDGYGYWMVAPLSKCGIVLLGDLSKIVPTGRQRIASVEDRSDGLRIQVRLAANEKSVVLSGASRSKPRVKGMGTLDGWDPTTGRFSVIVVGSKIVLY